MPRPTRKFAFTQGLGSHLRDTSRTSPPRGQEPRGGGVLGARGCKGGACGACGRWCRVSNPGRESTVTGSPPRERGRTDQHQGRCSPRAGRRAGRWLTVGEHRGPRGERSRPRGTHPHPARTRHPPSIGRRSQDAESVRGTDRSSIRTGRGRACGAWGRWCGVANPVRESTVTRSPTPERRQSDRHQRGCSPRAGQRAARWLTVGEHRRRRGTASRPRGGRFPRRVPDPLDARSPAEARSDKTRTRRHHDPLLHHAGHVVTGESPRNRPTLRRPKRPRSSRFDVVRAFGQDAPHFTCPERVAIRRPLPLPRADLRATVAGPCCPHIPDIPAAA